VAGERWLVAALWPPGRPGRPTLSVALYVHDAAASLDSTLAAILGDGPADMEVVAIDDGSLDAGFARLVAWAARDDRVRPYRVAAPRGPAWAANLAMAKAAGRFVAFCDAASPCHLDDIARAVVALTVRKRAVAALCDRRGVAGPGLDGLVLSWFDATTRVGLFDEAASDPRSSYLDRVRRLAGHGAVIGPTRGRTSPPLGAAPQAPPPVAAAQPLPTAADPVLPLAPRSGDDRGVLLFREPMPGVMFMAVGAAGLADAVIGAEAVDWPAGRGVEALAPDEAVTVIVPAYNRARTIAGAIGSLLRQSYAKLEILVVDDASSDDTATVAERVAASDGRVRVLRASVNRGTYWCANLALAQASGTYVVLHGSDDLALPHHIARLVLEMRRDPSLIAVYGQSARYTPDLRRVAGLRVMQAPALLRRSCLVERIGFFDSVRVAADSEMLGRLAAVYGAARLRRLRTLSYLALMSEDSLTRAGTAHAFRATGAGLRPRKSAARVDYHAAFRRWHGAILAGAAEPYLPFPPGPRPFPAPPEILPEPG
jgi:glycosyltransferase involved in cell wall biosynthesis